MDKEAFMRKPFFTTICAEPEMRVTQIERNQYMAKGEK
jgi:hypothetical protein